MTKEVWERERLGVIHEKLEGRGGKETLGYRKGQTNFTRFYKEQTGH